MAIALGLTKGAYAVTQNKIIAGGVLAFFILLPTWDLVIQKGVKTYYQLFKMEPKIYAMPEFDKDGKIESLGLGDVTLESIDYFKSKDKYSRYKNNYNIYFNKISNFIEITASIDSKISQLIRVFTQENSSKVYIKIDKQSARYQIVASHPISVFFGLYKKRTYQLVDTKYNNKVLAESFELRFSDKYSFIRRNILFWRTGTDSNLIYIGDIDNINSMLEKTTKFRTWINTNKGWK
jgi:hypothetical protein